MLLFRDGERAASSPNGVWRICKTIFYPDTWLTADELRYAHPAGRERREIGFSTYRRAADWRDPGERSQLCSLILAVSIDSDRVVFAPMARSYPFASVSRDNKRKIGIGVIRRESIPEFHREA